MSVPNVSQRRLATAAPRSLDETSRTAEFVASTETVDAHRTIVRQSWDLGRFSSNPVVLYNHDPEHPIGTAEVRVDEGVGLVARVRFAEQDPTADRVWNLVRQGVLRGVSVGFRPGEVNWEKRGGEEFAVFSDNTLFELSVTSQPSNPDALARSAEENMAKEDSAPAPETVTREVHDTTIAALKSAHEAEVRALTSTVASRDAEVQRLTAELTETRASFAAATETLIDAEVRALVPNKLDETQVDAFKALRKASPDSFKSIVAGLPDRKVIGAARVLPPEGHRARAADSHVGERNSKTYLEKVAELCARGVPRNEALQRALIENPHLASEE